MTALAAIQCGSRPLHPASKRLDALIRKPSLTLNALCCAGNACKGGKLQHCSLACAALVQPLASTCMRAHWMDLSSASADAVKQGVAQAAALCGKRKQRPTTTHHGGGDDGKNQCDAGSWPDKDHGLICGDCKVLVDHFDSKYKTCDGYCTAIGQGRCLGAWEESADTCRVKHAMKCSQALRSSMPSASVPHHTQPSALANATSHTGRTRIAGSSAASAKCLWISSAPSTRPATATVKVCGTRAPHRTDSTATVGGRRNVTRARSNTRLDAAKPCGPAMHCASAFPGHCQVGQGIDGTRQDVGAGGERAPGTAARYGSARVGARHRIMDVMLEKTTA